jgi:gliding motility-associated-like protein
VVDTNLLGNGAPANPLGDVVPGLKNVVLRPNVQEALCIIKGQTSLDYWLLGANQAGDSALVWRISMTGIQFQAGYPLGIPLVAISSISANPQGTRLGFTSFIENRPTLRAQFNPANGVVTNVQTVPGTPVGNATNYWMGFYSSAWSPDGTKLYLGKWRFSTNNLGGALYQYDVLQSANPLTSVFQINGGYNDVMGGLKLGPDQKVYFLYSRPNAGWRFAGVVDQPNLAGPACNVQATQVDFLQDILLSPSLPHTLPPNLPPVVRDTTLVLACETFPTILNLQTLVSDGDNLTHTWQMLQGSSHMALQGSQLTISAPPVGVLSDTLLLRACDTYCFPACDTGRVILIYQASGWLGPDVHLCIPQTLTLQNPISSLPFQWNTGSVSPSMTVSQAGPVILTLFHPTCPLSDTLMVTTGTGPDLQANLPSWICFPDTAVPINLNCPDCQWWINGQATQTPLLLQHAGNYEIIGQNLCGSDTLLGSLQAGQLPLIDLGASHLLCTPFAIDLSCVHCTYQWSNGTSNAYLQQQSPGWISVTVQHPCGQVTDSILLVMPPSMNVLSDTLPLFCPGDSFWLAPDPSFGPFLWNQTQTSDSFLVTVPGSIHVSFMHPCSPASDSVLAVFHDLEALDLGPDQWLCTEDTLWVGPASSDGMQGAYWNTGYSSLLHPVWEEETLVLYWPGCGTLLTDSITIQRSAKEEGLFIPSAFTPNKDGLNDVFQPAGIQRNSNAYQLDVFDRWGQVIFTTRLPQAYWDGNHLGEPVPSGAYVYKILYQNPCQNEFEYIGRVVLVR